MGGGRGGFLSNFSQQSGGNGARGGQQSDALSPGRYVARVVVMVLSPADTATTANTPHDLLPSQLMVELLKAAAKVRHTRPSRLKRLRKR